MNRFLPKFNKLKKRNSIKCISIAFNCVLMSLILIAFSSCSSVDCPNCQQLTRDEQEGKIVWNIALKNEIKSNSNTALRIKSITSDIEPIVVPYDNDTIWNNMNWTKFISENPLSKIPGEFHVLPKNSSDVFKLEATNIEEITIVSDPLQPPKNWIPKEPCACCCRVRDGFWIFDKFELRAMFAYRGDQKSVESIYKDGLSENEPKFFGTERGGSDMVFAAEIATYYKFLTWDLFGLPKSFQLGLLIGAMPTDGAVFIPIAIHPRITLNQLPSKFSNNCNTWYFFGDLGIPFDTQTKAPYIGKNMDFTRYFLGLGLGYEWAISCNIDFALDCGFRIMNLPLPSIKCCPDIPDDERNPFRQSTLGFIRLGLTF